MMPKIRITNAAHERLRSFTRTGEFSDPGHQLPGGDWMIELDADTLARLRDRQLAGETLSDTIGRIMATQRGAH